MIQIVVPSYNCEDWIHRCMESIKIQSYEEYDVVVIDDGSTDNSANYIEEFCSSVGWRYRLNPQNMGAGYNIYHGIHDYLECSFDDPILIVDGDDFLPRDGVLKRIADIYKDPNVWISWANYEPHPHNTGQTQSTAYPPDVIENRSYRQTGNYANHPLTFRYFLFDRSLDPIDLMVKGKWAKAGYDRMIMVPMLERAGNHQLYVPETLYAYNAINPISDVFVRLPEAQQAHKVVQSLPVKPLIDEAEVEKVRHA